MKYFIVFAIFFSAIPVLHPKHYCLEKTFKDISIFVNGKNICPLNKPFVEFEKNKERKSENSLRMTIDGLPPWSLEKSYKLIYIKFSWQAPPNTAYKFTYCLKTDITGKGGYVTAHLEQENQKGLIEHHGYTVFDSPSCIKETHDWTQYEFVFKTPPKRGKANYIVITLGGKGNDSGRIWLSKINLDKIPLPEKTKEIHIEKTGPSSYKLKWKKNKDKIKYYRIYKRSVVFQNTSQIPAFAIAGPNETSYKFQENRKDVQYFWAVTAVNDYGLENPETIPLTFIHK